MKIRTVTIGLLVGIVVWIAVTSVNAQQEPSEKAGTKLQTLLTAKRDSLKERFEFIKALHDNGTMTEDALIQSHELLLQAELELASTKTRRLQIHDERIKNFRRLEEIASHKFSAGTSHLAPKLLATVNRIQAEIDAQKERAIPK